MTAGSFLCGSQLGLTAKARPRILERLGGEMSQRSLVLGASAHTFVPITFSIKATDSEPTALASVYRRLEESGRAAALQSTSFCAAVYFLGLEEVQGGCLFGAEALLQDQPDPATGSKACGTLRQDCKPLALAAGLGSFLFCFLRSVDTQVNKEPARRIN